MSVPKRKNNINVYNKVTELGKDVTDNRQRLLDRITKSDTYLPDSIFHDDLDMGMLDFVKEHFVVTSDGEQIPIIQKILTLQRWSEFTNNWQFSDEDGNVKLPFIAVVRKPEVQPGTNPVSQRTIPDRMTFYYSSIPTWDGVLKGADIYKIPQPVAVDISFEVTIICTKFRDLNKFNKKVLQKVSSRQTYTSVKGHYIPIILEGITDTTPMEALDNRRFYVQTYKFLMMGYIVDGDEFEIKPAINRAVLTTEFITENKGTKTFVNKNVEIRMVTFVANGTQKVFSVGEPITELFYVDINGLIQDINLQYYHIGGTSKIIFVDPPMIGSTVTIAYYKSISGRDIIIDVYGNVVQVAIENFTYTGSNVFTTSYNINSLILVTINGLNQEKFVDYEITDLNQITINNYPFLPYPQNETVVGITYLF
jgi:hypothetical protein